MGPPAILQSDNGREQQLTSNHRVVAKVLLSVDVQKLVKQITVNTIKLTNFATADVTRVAIVA